MCGGGGGGVWQGLAWWGACMAEEAHVAGGSGMHGRGHAWQWGVGMHAPNRYYEIWSMSGQYASYWNAFLF